MKTNYSPQLAAMIAIAVLLSACNTMDENIAGVESGNVYVRVNKHTTKSNAAPVTDPTIVFNGGFLYFASGSGQITERLTVTDDNAALTESSVGIQTLEAGVVIAVPANSVSVYLPANVPASITLPATGAYTVVEQTLLSLNSQYDGTGGVTVATLYGGSTITAPVPPAVDASAVIEVRPLASRIEISTITGGTGISGTWKVDGIFINAFDLQQYIDAERYAASFQDNQSIPGNYVSGTTGYPTADNGLYYDYNTAGIGSLSTNVYAPATAGNVWSYNLFAGLLPHIVIRLTGITGYNDPQFLTVRTYQTGTGTPITVFERGKIYRIPTIAFDADDLSEVPEPILQDVAVTVNLIDWTFEDGVQPGF